MIRLVGGLYRSDLLASLDFLDHGFGTRERAPWDDSAPVAALRQIHSAVAVPVSGRHGLLGEGDALHTRRKGVWLEVRTADCVPVILADSDHGAVATIHAGWRGVAAEIVPLTLAALHRDYGTQPERVVAAIGPSIGECCYEVGSEVANQLARWWPDRPDLGSLATTQVDLSLTIVRQLTHAGVRIDTIDHARLCTKCNPATLHSFRRDGNVAGRMKSGAMVR